MTPYIKSIKIFLHKILKVDVKRIFYFSILAVISYSKL